MYSITPFILIVLSLAVMIFVVVKKFPQLTLLDVNSIPEVKVEKKKNEFYKKRAEEGAKGKSIKTKKFLQPFVQKWRDLQLVFRKYVGQVQRQMIEKSEKKKVGLEKVDKTEELKIVLQEGEYALGQGDFDTAEKKYIEAVRLDPKNVEAYYGLGNVYYVQDQIEEALETLKFVLQLDENDIKTLVKLAEIEEERNDIETAVEYYQRVVLVEDNNPHRFAKLADLLVEIKKYDTALEAVAQAVEIEPQNPKYLDKMIEISVLCDNKKVAEETYQKLRMVNPENQKLVSLKVRIDEME